MAMTREYLDLVENAIDIAPVGSQEEVQAAEFILNNFEEHGLHTEFQDISAPLYGRAVTGIFLVLSFAAALLSGLGGIGLAVIGFIVGLFVFAYLASQYLGSNPVAEVGPQAQSQNIIGIHKGEGAHAGRGVRPIVVMARYDTGREEILARPALAGIAPLLWQGAPWFLIIVFLCTLIELFQFLPAGVLIAFWIVGMVASLPLILLGVNEVAAPFQNLTDGANDNKAALAALFGVLEDVVPTNAEELRMRAARLAHAEHEEAHQEEEKEREVVETQTVMREEPVVGVRHGKAVLEAIGMLPSSCEIIYEKPKLVPVVEERRVMVREEPKAQEPSPQSYEEPEVVEEEVLEEREAPSGFDEFRMTSWEETGPSSEPEEPDYEREEAFEPEIEREFEPEPTFEPEPVRRQTSMVGPVRRRRAKTELRDELEAEAELVEGREEDNEDPEKTSELTIASFEDTSDLGATGELDARELRVSARRQPRRISVSDPNATGTLSRTGELAALSSSSPATTNGRPRRRVELDRQEFIYVGETPEEGEDAWKSQEAQTGETQAFDMSTIESPSEPERSQRSRASRASRAPRTAREYLRSVPSSLDEMRNGREGALRRSLLVDLPDPTEEQIDPLASEVPAPQLGESGDMGLAYREEAYIADVEESLGLGWENDAATNSESGDEELQRSLRPSRRRKLALGDKIHLPHVSLKRKKKTLDLEEDSGDTAEQEALNEASSHRGLKDRLSFLHRRGHREESLDEWLEDDEELLEEEDDWKGGATRASGQRGSLRLVGDDPEGTIEMSMPASFGQELEGLEYGERDPEDTEVRELVGEMAPSGEIIYVSQAGRGGNEGLNNVQEEVEELIEDAEDAEDVPDDELADAVLAMGDVDLVAHDIWFVCVGASSLGHAGTKAFVEAHRRELRGCLMINLDSIGAGELTLIANEGYGDTRRGDKRIAKLIENAAKKLHVSVIRANREWEDTDVTPALRRSMRGLTIMGTMGGKIRALAQTPEDTQENLNPNLVVYTSRLVSEAIRHA